MCYAPRGQRHCNATPASGRMVGLVGTVSPWLTGPDLNTLRRAAREARGLMDGLAAPDAGHPHGRRATRCTRDARVNVPVSANDPDVGPTVLAAPGGTAEDRRMVAALRAGDEAAFTQLVRRHHAALVRVAQTYVPSQAVAEEVAQETWMAVISGIDRFEGRSSLKTWLFRILIYRARARGERERRTTPWSALALADDDGGTASDLAGVDPSRFRGADALWAGHWAAPPRRWDGDAEARLEAGETMNVLRAVVDALPAHQREVLLLRDVYELSAADVCEALGISAANQRVLLHRARGKARAALEQYLDARAGSEAVR